MSVQVLSVILVLLATLVISNVKSAFISPLIKEAKDTRTSTQSHCSPVRPSRSASQGSPAVALALGITAAEAARRRVQRRATVQQWNSRVKRIEGGRAVFDVTLPKPLGLTPRNFPNRPGVGVAKINPGGNTDLWNRQVLLEDADGMFIMEGDEVVAVNGTVCEGQDLEKVSKLVKESEGDTLTLKLVRNYLTGPVKIVWKPSLKMATYKRGAILRACEETLGANVRYSCEDGWCSSCWHAEENYMTVYRICKMDVKNTKGVLCKNLMQADGVKPPRKDGKMG
eukprot:symbB.v1.2.031701.t1/scaffold3709.1/size51634/5